MRTPKLLARQRVQQLAQGRGWRTAWRRAVEARSQAAAKRAKRPPVRSSTRGNVAGFTQRASTKVARKPVPQQRCFRARARAPWRSPWRGETAFPRSDGGLRTARARAGSRWGYQTPAFAGKDRSWPPRSTAVSRRPAVRKRHLQPRAVVAFQASGHSRLPRKKGSTAHDPRVL